VNGDKQCHNDRDHGDQNGIRSKCISIRSRLPLNRILKKEDLGGATGRHHRPPHFTGFWRLEGLPPVRLAVGPSDKAPLTAEMEIRVLGVANRPTAVMLLEGGYRLVLLLLGHDTSFLHAHGARQDCLLRVGCYPLYGNGLCALQYARRLQSRTHRASRESVATRGAEIELKGGNQRSEGTVVGRR
jgi:hypothetical protein